jgi:hypothetical protein
MKVLVFVKATPNSEKGLPPTEQMQQMFEAMGKYNEQLVKAGILQEADGLKPSSAGKRVTFSGDKVSVIDGPFAETKELVAGYWVWNVKSMDEALEWAKRCPNPMPGEEGMLELRPTYSDEDFGEMITDEHRERMTQMREEVAARKKAGSKPQAKQPMKKPVQKKATKTPKKKAKKQAKKKASAKK